MRTTYMLLLKVSVSPCSWLKSEAIYEIQDRIQVNHPYLSYQVRINHDVVVSSCRLVVPLRKDFESNP